MNNLLSAVNGSLVLTTSRVLKFKLWWTEIAVGSTQVTSATLHLHVQAVTNYTPITIFALLPRLVAGTIYRPKKDG